MLVQLTAFDYIGVIETEAEGQKSRLTLYLAVGTMNCL